MYYCKGPIKVSNKQLLFLLREMAGPLLTLSLFLPSDLNSKLAKMPKIRGWRKGWAVGQSVESKVESDT